jgi:hypothetical protein
MLLQRLTHTIVFLSMSSLLYGQAMQPQPIEIVYNGVFKNKVVYKKCEIELMPTQLINLFAKDEKMKQHVAPMSLYYISSILLKTGATALITWPLADAIENGDKNANWDLAYIGLGCLALSIPLDILYQKRARKAVDYYNSGYVSGYSKQKEVEFGFEVKGSNAGLSLRF